MAEITVRALDSALAMEEIQKRLGDEALIISTKRVDGKIEITATDEELRPLEKKGEPLLLSDAFRTGQFASILDEKVSEGRDQTSFHSSDDFYSTIETNISNIYGELEHLKFLVNNVEFKEEKKLGTLDKLQILGFRKTTLRNFTEITNETDISVALRKLAKSFVNGKCRHFDDSNLYFITGKPNSGKTTFASKFIALQKSVDDTRDFTRINDSNRRKLISSIKNLEQQTDVINGTAQKAIVVDTKMQNEDLDLLIAEIQKVRPDLKISIICTLEVGSSYEMVIRSKGLNTSERQYLAFTKLDLCDISIPEISAILELSKKCMFFSGIDKLKDGAYFAKLDQVESYLSKKLKEEIE